MQAPLSRRRSWQWPLGLLALVVFAQACGGSSSNTAGPSGGTRITLHFTGLERALLPSTCTGVLEVSAPDMATARATIPPSGQVTILITPGPARLFVVILTCQKTDGVQTYTAQQVADVIPGQPLDLTFNLQVNDPPKVSVACSPSSILVGQTSSCSCRATDRDPGDQAALKFSFSSNGSLSTTSGPNTTFSSGTAGTFDVTCAVSDGKSTSSASTSVTVNPPGSSSLTVAVVGSGTVASAPPGISCPSTCSASFVNGTAVTLTASPAAGATFTGWSVAACGTASTCTVTVTGPTSVTATFTGAMATLTVAVAGNGTVRSAPPGISCPSTCSASFTSGTVVTLTAVAGVGSAFTGWSGGGCSGTGTCVVVLSANVAVTATFQLTGSITVSNTDLDATLTGVVIPGAGTTGVIGPGTSATIQGVAPGSYTASAGDYYGGVATTCPAFGPFTVPPGGNVTIHYQLANGSPLLTCSVF